MSLSSSFLQGHSGGISCVQFDSSRIVSGSHDKTIRVWNIKTNSPWSVMTLAGHSGEVRCLHLHGSRLASGSRDATIKVWDLETKPEWSSIGCKVTMVGHQDTVRWGGENSFSVYLHMFKVFETSFLDASK